MENKKILLVGNPNVGKSAIFHRITGAKVTISNYPGTTVGFTQGKFKTGENSFGMIVDIPGIYNLEPLSKADEVTCEMIEEGDVIVNVVDATNLERNLFLTLELMEKGIPMVIALNMWDETRHKGIEIDIKKLEEELKMPVISTCGLTGEGIKKLVLSFKEAKIKQNKKTTSSEKWEKIGRIVQTSQVLHHHHHTLFEWFEEISIKPGIGLFVAALILFISFTIVRTIGEGLITYVLDPLFNNVWIPVLNLLTNVIGETGFLHEVLIGNLVNGKIDFGVSFGILTTGLYIPIAAVLPYILSFYLVLGILEDWGYLPRLATQVDNFMHKIGLHGYAIVPMILGLGCNVPGAMALRLLENRREKFIAATLLAITVPCMAQIAMIVGLVGERGGQYVALIFGILFLLLIIKGLIMNKFMPGSSPEILWEIPPYRKPQIGAVLKKLRMRIYGFLKEALPLVLIGVLVINVLYLLNVIQFLSNLAQPLLSGLWGLPKETISAMLVGFFRKDVAVGMLGPLNLTIKQLIISCTILAVYFPCIATFMIMVKELGLRDMIKSALIMMFTAIMVGIILNLVL